MDTRDFKTFKENTPTSITLYQNYLTFTIDFNYSKEVDPIKMFDDPSSDPVLDSLLEKNEEKVLIKSINKNEGLIPAKLIALSKRIEDVYQDTTLKSKNRYYTLTIEYSNQELKFVLVDEKEQERIYKILEQWLLTCLD